MLGIVSRRALLTAALSAALATAASAQSMCTLVCPANITVPSLPGQQVSAAVNYAVPVPNGCVATSATQTAGLPTGQPFGVGVTTNAFAAGMEATCQFTVTVTATPALPVPPTQVPVGGGALLAALGLITALGGVALLRRKPR